METYATGIATGEMGRIDWRLKSIDVTTGVLRVRTYATTYTSPANTTISMLSSLREYGRDAVLDSLGNVAGGTSLPAVNFSYTNDGTSVAASSVAIPKTGLGQSESVIDAGDYDGDGAIDVVKNVSIWDGRQYQSYWYLQRLIGSAIGPSTILGGTVTAPVGTPPVIITTLFGDFNGAGKREIYLSLIHI